MLPDLQVPHFECCSRFKGFARQIAREISAIPSLLIVILHRKVAD
jgi:hypothetical protein